MSGDRFGDAFKAALNDIRDELITRGWFGRNPGAGSGQSITIAEGRQDSPAIEPGQGCASIALGWEFPKEPEPEHDREARSHDIDR